MAVSSVYLHNGLAVGGTVTIAYPPGVTAAQVAMAARTFLVGGTAHAETTAFTLALGTSSMTMTWIGPSAIPPLTSAALHVQLAEDVEAIYDGFGRRLSHFGTVDTSGTVRMDEMIVEAMTACVADGVPLILGPGDYAIGAPIRVISGAKIIMSPRTRLLRRFSGSNVITQASLATQISNVLIRGGSIVNDLPDTYTTGASLSLNAADSAIEDIFLDGHNNAGVVALIAGDRNRINRINHIEATHTGGGIALHASTDTRVSDCYVECSDDCFQIGSSGLNTNPYFGLDSRGNQYVNCTGRSRDARLAVIGAARAGVEPLLSDANITDCAFIGVRGRGRLGITVVNTLLTGKVARVDFIGCHVDCSEDTVGGVAAFTVTDDNVAGSGGVEDINVVGGSFVSPFHSAVNVYGTAVRRVTFNGTFIGAPRGTRESIRVNGDADVTFRDCTIQCPPDDNGAWVGFGDAGNTARARFTGCHFYDIANGMDGLAVYTSAAVRIEDCRFEAAAGSTTAQAFSVVAGSGNVTVGRNDYDAIPVAEKFNWPTTVSEGCAIDTQTLRVTSAASTLRAWQSGTTTVLTGATNRNHNLPACRYGLRFSMVQEGTGLAKFTAAAGDVIRVGASVTATGGNIEATAQGDSVDLAAINDTTWLAVSRNGTWTVT